MNIRQYVSVVLFILSVLVPAYGWAAEKEPVVLVINLSGPIDNFDPALAAVPSIESNGAKPIPISTVEAFLSKPENARLKNCKSVECMSELARALHADYVLSIRARTPKNKPAKISLMLIDPRKESIIQRFNGTAKNTAPTAIGILLDEAISDISANWQISGEPASTNERSTKAETPTEQAQPQPQTTEPAKPEQNLANDVHPIPDTTDSTTQETEPTNSAQTEPEPNTNTEQMPAPANEPALEETTKEPEDMEADKDSDEEKEEEHSSSSKLAWRGDLTTIGPLDVIIPDNRVGIAVGYRRMFAIHYLYVAPVVDLHFFDDQFAFSLDLPLNFELFDSRIDMEKASSGESIGFEHAGRLRPEDWDEWRDYFKIIHYIRYGHKEDKFYFNINRDMANTLGHGFLLRRYIPSHEISYYRLSMAMDAYNDYAGFQLYTNDLTSFDVSGALVFIKPFAIFSDNTFLRSISFGYTAVVDRDAPIYLDPGDVDEYGRFIVLDDGIVLGHDIDMEMKLYRGENLDIKFYLDYAMLMPFKGSDPSKANEQLLDSYSDLFGDWRNRSFDGGWGFTFGTLWRLSWGDSLLQAIRIRAEGRYFTDNYSPSYFDALYELQKWKFISEEYPAQGIASEEATGEVVPTKFVDVFTRSGDNHFGGLFEFSYAIKEYFGMTIATEGATGEDQSKFLAHVEVPALSFLRLSATYYKWNYSDWSSLFSLTDSNAILISAARVHPLPLLYFNVGFRKTLKPSDKRISRMENTFDMRIDVEFSWEW